MTVGWNGKKDAIGMIVILLLVPIIAMITGLFMPIIKSHPVLFGAGYLTVIAVGFIYIIKKKR
jgi:hypothetical protein